LILSSCEEDDESRESPFPEQIAERVSGFWDGLSFDDVQQHVFEEWITRLEWVIAIFSVSGSDEAGREYKTQKKIVSD
jgi:hypothetical protein